MQSAAEASQKCCIIESCAHHSIMVSFRNALSNSVTAAISVRLGEQKSFKCPVLLSDLGDIDDGGSYSGCWTPPSLWRGRPLRLISSFTRSQSGDIIPQLFTTNKLPQSKIKSISSELGALLEACIIWCRYVASCMKCSGHFVSEHFIPASDSVDGASEYLSI